MRHFWTHGTYATTVVYTVIQTQVVWVLEQLQKERVNIHSTTRQAVGKS